MLQRPGSRKKKGKNSKKDHAKTLKLFAFCLFLVPGALGIAAWVMREEIWINLMMENSMSNYYKPRMLRALGRDSVTKDEVREASDRLVQYVQSGDLKISDLMPIKERFDLYYDSDEKFTKEEAREVLDLLKDALQRIDSVH